MSVQVSARRDRADFERALLIPLIAVVVTVGAWIWAVVAAGAARTAVASAGALAVLSVCAAAALAAHFAEAARRSRARLRAVEADAAHRRQEMASRAELEEEIAQLAEETLPALVARMREEKASLGTVLAEVRPASDPALDRLLQLVVREIAGSERSGAAAMAACAGAAARVQAQTTRLLADLRDLEHRYSEDEVFADLLDLDHRISQMGRLADGIALLSGGRSGRRWTKPITMESILRGAMGRIDGYRRVRTHCTSTAAVVGFAAEGVMHALAELMDNAATFSTRGSEVRVYVEEEDAGIVVTIEDGGLGMRRRERERAERLVSESLDLTTLSGTRMGLAVVGRLAAKHGLSVSFRPSSRGGTGVIVMIPRNLITQARDEGEAAPAASRTSGRTPPFGTRRAGHDGAADQAPAGGAATVVDDPDDLPRRRRGETLRTAPPRARPSAVRTSGPRESGARFAAFRQAGRARREDREDRDDRDDER